MKIFKLLPILLITVIILSCSSEDEDNNSSETYLTINGDTREIINNGDSELKITKEVANYTGETFIRLLINDPNNSLIANFGGYNNNNFIGLIFHFPNTLGSSLESGEYPTYCCGGIGGYRRYTTFSTGEFVFYSNNSKQTFNLKEYKNKWIVEFKDLEYVGEAGEAIISGRIILNK
ncbi:hypothetical protein MPF19_18245 [Polaribacter sp. Z014]|uniref:hypothetical protein n=1 Tax=Polaribacter sp. Z014 TaxID=2927126 RepID=UPI0020221873|nr:hypothetical protein [Polaribacter sp. Z014]MCL7765367.1 hypothetical protein [Polaribacter sp. Z014]